MNLLFTALPTPFWKNKIDFNSLEKLFLRQKESNVDGVVLSGSTGEGHNLSSAEWIDLIKFGVKQKEKKNKFDIIAGVGFNSTNNAVEYAKKAEQIGVDYILVTVPYYNKPQQEGIYQHFASICNAVKTKIIMYNVPSRTVTDMQNETIVRLIKDFSNIVALKDATGKLERVADLKNRLSKELQFQKESQNKEKDDKKRIKNSKKTKKKNDYNFDTILTKEKNNSNIFNFKILSGEDITQIGFNAMGGNGVISVVSNIAPKLCKKIQTLCEKDNYTEALKLQNELTLLSHSMFIETNPVPVKYALYKLGIFKCDELRLPLVKLSEKSKKIIDEALKIIS